MLSHTWSSPIRWRKRRLAKSSLWWERRTWWGCLLHIGWHWLETIEIVWHWLGTIDIGWGWLETIEIGWHLLETIEIWWHLSETIEDGAIAICLLLLLATTRGKAPTFLMTVMVAPRIVQLIDRICEKLGDDGANLILSSKLLELPPVTPCRP